MRLRLNLPQIEAYPATSLERSELRPTAAVVPIQRRAPEDQIVFIRRVTHLRSHPGEISFPGGSTEPGDSDLRSTALRELTEEIGIAPHKVSIVGRLDQIEVGNRYVLTPFVATISPRGAFKYNPDEVQEVLTFPIENFLRPGSFSIRPYLRDGHLKSTFYFKCGNTTIWGATARILKLLLEIACGAKFPSK